MRNGIYINDIIERRTNKGTFLINKKVSEIKPNEIIYIPKISVQQLANSMLSGTTFVTNKNLIQYFGSIDLSTLENILFNKFAITKSVLQRYNIIDKVLQYLHTCTDNINVCLSNLNWFDLVPLQSNKTLLANEVVNISYEQLLNDYHTLNSFELFEKYGYCLYSVLKHLYSTQMSTLNNLIQNVDTNRANFIKFCTKCKNKHLLLCTDTFTKTIELKSKNNLLEMINIANMEIYKMKRINKLWYNFTYSINNTEKNSITITMYYLQATKDCTAYVLYHLYNILTKKQTKLFIRTIYKLKKFDSQTLNLLSI